MLDALAVGAQAYDDVDARVLEVARVRVALRAVAEDRHGLAVQEVQISVVVVKHDARSYAVATATHVRAGIARVPSGCSKGSAAFSRSASTSLLCAKSMALSASWVRVEVSVC